jgi:hypothetical protein
MIEQESQLFEAVNGNSKMDTRTTAIIKQIDILKKETKTIFETKLDKSDFSAKENDSADVIAKIHADLDRKESTAQTIERFVDKYIPIRI